jgi:toxin ParE1/3/4
MNVEWTEKAAGHLEAIKDYISRDSPKYAQSMAERIVRKSERLADFPLLGAEVPEYGDESIREVLEYPYRIIYRPRSERIEILAVIHGARELPPKPTE